jgi:serine protease AprX
MVRPMRSVAMVALVALALMLGGPTAAFSEGFVPSAQVSSGWVESDLIAGDPVHPMLRDLIEDATSDAMIRVIVQYESFAAIDRAILDAIGAAIHYEAAAAPMIFVTGTPEVIRLVATIPGVTAIHADQELEFDLESAVHTGRAYHVWGHRDPSVLLPDGRHIDGSGIGVAVVDTGINGLHPDLQLGKTTARNLEAVGIPVATGEPVGVRFIDNDHTDANGHGSHVGGIVAGSGELSGGRHQGSAPGAMIYGFGSNVLSLWYGVAAWDWVYQYGAEQDPPIRIITNSWGTGHGACALDHPLTVVQQRLVLEKDVVMIFSSGNTGRDQDGSEDVGRTQYKCPWQGNIGVASMDDRGERDRDGPASAFTARGKKDEPNTWPHISAPGSNITAPRGGTTSWAEQCAGRHNVNLDTKGCYLTISGTSMSTPFVAGVAALLLQANPALKPADVQYILQQTAYKFGENVTYHEDENGDYRYHGSHYYRGHGLVDAEAAVAFALDYDPAAHPVVYTFDEAPVPLWEYGLLENQTAGLDAAEAGSVAVSVVAIMVVGSLVAAVRRRG